MSLKKLRLIILTVGIAAAAVSCKKDEDTQTSPTLDGILTFSSPEFLIKDGTLTMTPKGVTHPEGGIIGYYWKVVPGMDKYDTTRFANGLNTKDETGVESDGTFTHSFKEGLDTYTIYCYAFAKGYTGSSCTRYVTTVAPGRRGSVTGAYLGEQVTVNGQTWTAHNCHESAGSPFRKADVMSDVFGRYYNYEQAIAACDALQSDDPAFKWCLPSEEDWIALGTSLGGTTEAGKHEPVTGIAKKLMVDALFNGNKMWEYWPAVGHITNESNMSVIPVGYANLGEMAEDGSYPSASFTNLYKAAAFWTSTEVEDNESMAYYRYLRSDEPDLFVGKGDKLSLGASVRCIRKPV